MVYLKINLTRSAFRTFKSTLLLVLGCFHESNKKKEENQRHHLASGEIVCELRRTKKKEKREDERNPRDSVFPSHCREKEKKKST